MKRNIFQLEEQRLREDSRLKPTDPPSRKPITAKPSAHPARKPLATARELGMTDLHEVDCSECGGSGFDPGSVDPFGELCPRCQGSKKELIRRDYLAEAFRICADPDPQFRVERAHVVAIVEHCRKWVSAAIILTEVA